MKFFRSVVMSALGGLSLACATPMKEQPTSAGSAGPSTSRAASAPTDSARSADPSLSSAPQPNASAAAAHAAAASDTGAAYVGCGEPIPPARLWDETTEGQVLNAISAAKACAAEHDRRLLLEFVAPWCEDCQELARLDQTEVVARTLQRRYERVRVNVGKWDRHEGLRNTYGVHALATYVVIDPKTSQELAKTTLEPITKKGQKLSAEDWAGWLEAHWH